MATRTQITAENQWSPGLRVRGGNDFDVAILGSFDATVTIQRKRVNEDDGQYRDVVGYTGPNSYVGQAAGDYIWRVGVKTGDFTSGSIEVEIST